MKNFHIITDKRRKELQDIGKSLGNYTAFYKSLGELVYRNSVNDHSKDDELQTKMEKYKKRLNLIWNLGEKVVYLPKES